MAQVALPRNRLTVNLLVPSLATGTMITALEKVIDT